MFELASQSSLRTRLAAVCLAPLVLAAGCETDGPEEANRPGAMAEPVLLSAPTGAGSGQAHLALTSEAQALLSWLEPAGQGHVLKHSVLRDGAWSTPRAIASRTDFFVNWADFASVQPITSGIWAAHWLQRAHDSFASYDIALSISTDGGASFSEGRLLNDDGTLSEHGFVSLFAWGEAIGAVWLDGRRLAEQLASGAFDAEAPPVGVSLRYARVAHDGTVTERGELDELVCDCCQTDVALAGIDPVLVYRDRTPEEIRDIVARRHTAEGWQPPVTLGPDRWHVEGCPVNGPSVAASGDDVAVAWFTAAKGRGRVRFARSSDGGVSFGEPLDLDAEGAFGHADVALLAGGSAAVSWWRRAARGRIALAVREVDADGALGEIHIIAENDVAQPLDVPQMVAAREGLVLAWTDVSESRVRTALLRRH